MGEEGKPPIQMSLRKPDCTRAARRSRDECSRTTRRQIDGLGQRIVVNMQACIVWTLMNEQRDAVPATATHLSRTEFFVGSA